jgi:transcriptional regulator with XRE-family HTH domain
VSTVFAMSTERNEFARNLREARGRAGLTQERLAELCELHRTEISLLGRAERSPRLETVVALSRALMLASPCELLRGIA